MQFWFLLLIGNVIVMSLGETIGKIFIHRVHAYQILFYQYIASIITTSLYLLWLKPEVHFSDVPFWYIIIGFMYAFGISANYNAKRQSLSKTAILTKSKLIVVVVLSVIFLGEYKIFSFHDIAGIKHALGLLAMLGALFLFYNKKIHAGSEEKFDYGIWIKWITFYIVIMGLAQFIVKYAVTSYEPLLVLRLQYVGSFGMIALLCVLHKKTLLIGWKNILGSFVIGIFISTGLSLLYTALSLSTATQVFSIAAVGTVILTAFVGVALFKEKITKRMIIPFILGLLSIYLLK